MTQAKKLKRAIRARARKTGESYTAARRHVVTPTEARPRPEPAALPAATPPPATRGQLNDMVALEKTGYGLDHWFAVLDAFGAPAKGHTAAARHLRVDHEVASWYCQGITVAYERARGLRALNQSCRGDFQVSVSRAVTASVAEVSAAIGDENRRRQWLRGADPGLAKALDAAFKRPDARGVKVKDAATARLRYPWDGTQVEISIFKKAKGVGSTVTATSTKLLDGADVERRRAQWKPVMDALKAHLKE